MQGWRRRCRSAVCVYPTHRGSSSLSLTPVLAVYWGPTANVYSGGIYHGRARARVGLRMYATYLASVHDA